MAINQRSKESRVYKKRAKRKKWLRVKNKIRNRPSLKIKRTEKKEIYRRINENKTYSLPLPKNFSFIENPDEVLAFFHNLKRYLKDQIPVTLDFQNVEKITPDVITLLLAKISNPRFLNNTRVYGNRPLNPDLDTLLFESGFYKIVGIDKTKPTNGMLDTMKSKIVDPQVALEARKLTSEKTFNCDKRLHPLYRTLIECMANTKKHASGKQTGIKETWWLAVYNDPATKITSFSFCDTGVGIFKSTKMQTFTKFALAIGLKKNSDILMKILEGRVESSTGLHYRGKGLPKIYSDYKNKALSRLFIVANDVFADFDSGTFIELKNPLNGTFLYWEILPN
jgi:hypothetical protein